MVHRGRPSAGCQNCRNRHIKCDETRPHCRACVRSGRSCPGYKHPLDVMLRGQKAFFRRNRGTGGLDCAESDGGLSAQSTVSGSVGADFDEALETQQSNEHAHLSDARLSSTTSTIQAKPPSIPSSPYLPLEDTVIPLFINSYLYMPKDPQINDGFLGLLPQSYSNTRPGSHLHLATLAVSFFSVAAWTGQRSLLRSSELFFLKALPRTREALQGEIGQNLNEVLMTILLLSTYEEFYAMKDWNRPAKAHLRGAIALVNTTRREQLDSPVSKTLAHAVQAQIIRTSLELGYPVIQTPNLWPLSKPMAPTTPVQLAIAASQLVNLRLEWEALTSTSQPQAQPEIAVILSKANTLDTKLTTWSHSVPPHWIPVPATTVPQSVREAGVFHNHCDCYPDLWVAGIWSLYRDTRIAVLNIVLACLRILDTHHTEAIQSTLSAIQSLATDICATVPFFLGSQTTPVQLNPNLVEYPEADGRGVTSAHRHAAPLLGGWYILAYLGHICAPGLGLSEEQLGWIQGQMRRALRIYTFD